MSIEVHHYIGGEWAGADEDRIGIVDPRTGDVVARSPAGSSASVRQAVSSAAKAQSGWAATPLESRMAVVESWADAIEEHVDELAQLQRLEMGQPLEFGRTILSSGVAELRASVADAERYEFQRDIANGDTGVTRIIRNPLGVAAAITPWNFPITTILAAIGPLVLAGNTVVVKPSELCPISTARMFAIVKIPDGVMNLVLGDARTGQPLVEHADVELVHFTGSVATGKRVALASAGLLRRTVLELGGKDPVVVDADVDPVATAQAVAFGAFMNTGQICTSMERIYVHRDIAPQFIDALVDAAGAYTYSDSEGTRDLNELGPMVSERQRANVHAQVEDAVRQGATALIGGSIPEGRGYFYPATVLVGVDDDMDIMTEETFGPVAPVHVVDSFDEGLARASRSRYALAATVYTSDAAHARSAEGITAGLVWINAWQGGGPGRIYEPARESGMGATGSFAAFDAATRPSSVFIAAAG